MKLRRPELSFSTRNLFPILLLTLLLGSLPVHADKVVTVSGQTLEGIIKDENSFNIRIDVRGVIVPVPRERIKEVTRNSNDENVRTCLDKAQESLSRNDISSARTLVNQARTLSTQEAGLIDNINRLDKDITDQEQRGGTAEERHLRAEELLRRANDAFDKIKNDEGNAMLIQALRTDPTYEPAHQKINQLLKTGNRSDHVMLAAEYFNQVLYPDHLRNDSPVIALLPAVYSNIVVLFEASADTQKAAHYVELMRNMTQAFASHPAWKEGAEPAVQALLNKPLDTLLTEKIQTNLEKGNYEMALQKLQGWTPADTTPEILKLYARAYIGTEQYRDARKVIEQSMEKFSDVPELRPQYNALNMVVQAEDAEKNGDKAGAIGTFEKVFTTRANLLPEMGEVIGRRLARLRAPELDKASGRGLGWQAADVSALIMRYGQDLNVKKQAATTMIESLRLLTWNLELKMAFEGKEVILPPEMIQLAMDAMAKPLGLPFDSTSPFVIQLYVDCRPPAPLKTDELVKALNGGNVVTSPFPIIEMTFNLEATHPILGSLFKESWFATEVTPLEAAPAPSGGKPAPGKPGAPPAGGPGAKPGAKPAAPAAPVAPPPPAGKPATAAQAQLMAKVQKAINEGKYNIIQAEFSKELAAKMPLDKTTVLVKMIVDKYGKIQKIDPPVSPQPNAVLGVAHMDKGVMDLVIMVDAQNKINSVGFAEHVAAGAAFNGPTVATIQNMDSIKQFIVESLGVKYVSPKVTYLPSRLRIPYMQEILREQAEKMQR